ncbi:hypothetical protein BC833DRAFT_623890 [Globomyces pollinis-pini]|nr:hypothetical protein BC833DRAFT_623890 [Globomyces pollinis-pini]
MISSSTLVQARRVVRGENHLPPGQYGPLHFAGCNWRGNGALPFGVKNRVLFQIGFWTVSAIGLSLPFIGTERKLMPIRIAKWKAAREAAE